MKPNQPLVNKKYLLEKFPGKGGWTYARIPEIQQDRQAYFGWVKVKGTIDGYAISQYNLMPMGNGMLFLPVKATIRKVIKKEAGNYVHVVLYADNDKLVIPEPLLQCLKDEPEAYEKFMHYRDAEQKAYIQWIESAKQEVTKANRIATTIAKVLQGLNHADKYE